MIVVQQVITADDLDVLAGTDLANIPELGILAVWAASTVNDTLMSITGPGSEPVVRTQVVILRANGMPDRSTDTPYLVGVVQGGHYVVNVDVVTAATVTIMAIYLDQEDVAAGVLQLIIGT